MKKSKFLSYIFLAILTSFLVGCSLMGQTMAEVNGEKITRQELDKRMDPIKKLYQAQYNMDFSDEKAKETLKRLEQGVLEQMVTEKLILQEAKKENIKVEEGEVKGQVDRLIKERFPSQEAFNQFMKEQKFSLSDLESELKSQLIAEKLADKVIVQKKINVSDQEAKEYFQAHQASYNIPELVRARHILVKDKAQAEKILKELEGGKDFALEAKKYSLDPGSKEKGGDLGYFGRGQMVPPFEKAAFSLKIGQTSGIIQSDYGYHIIKLEDHKKERVFQFQQVRGEVKKQLENIKKKDIWEKYLADLRLNGKIKIYR